MRLPSLCALRSRWLRRDRDQTAAPDDVDAIRRRRTASAAVSLQAVHRVAGGSAPAVSGAASGAPVASLIASTEQTLRDWADQFEIDHAGHLNAGDRLLLDYIRHGVNR